MWLAFLPIVHQCGRLLFEQDQGLGDESGLEVLMWDQGHGWNGYGGERGAVERAGRKMMAG